MDSESRVLDVVNLDDLEPQKLDKVLQFFNSEFPGVASKFMDDKFFTSKIQKIDTFQTGYLTVAMHEDQVVGTCSAIRKEIQVDGLVLQAVEIGDTYTSVHFRRNCHFREPYSGTNSSGDYLNKSIFGRLATETLDRAILDGVQFVYGVPNHQAKLSWIGKLDFGLFDGNSTYRISSPTLTHPSIRGRITKHLVYSIYYYLTLFYSKFITSKYRLEQVSNFDDLENATFLPTIEQNSEKMQLRNSNEWLQRRFLNNSDKSYEVIQIRKRRNQEICGYLFFLLQTRLDGFGLLINSKDLYLKKDLGRMRMPFSRIAVKKFFLVENVSMWIDSEISKKYLRFLYGYPAKPTKVEIVAKYLTSDLENQKSEVRFYNFQYGDSDLG